MNLVLFIGAGIAAVFGFSLGALLVFYHFQIRKRLPRICALLLLGTGLAAVSSGAFVVVIWPPFGALNLILLLALALIIAGVMRKKPERGTACDSLDRSNVA